MADPLYNEIDASNLESVRKNVIFDNLFVDTPGQAKLRKAGVFDPFLGGNGMVEGFLYGRVQGAALAPGSTVTVTRQQLNSALKFQPKAYVTWSPLDDWEMDDGSGTGGVINSGPAMIVNMYQVIMENMSMTMNTMLEMDMFRHGQPASALVADDRRFNSNGLSEALNNGVDPSWDGNVFTTYGGQVRNGAIGPALNSTPLYLGNSSGAPGQIDFNALMRGWGQCNVAGGNPDLGLTNVLGFVAIANALDAQRRDISNTKHDIQWKGLNFQGIDIYSDPLAPSALAGDFLSLAPTPGTVGNPGANNNLADGAGNSTLVKPFVTPQFVYQGANVPTSPTGSNLPSNTTIQAAEVLMMLECSSFKVRPTNKKGWNYGLRRAPMPNNISIDALFMRLGINLYNVQPRHNTQLFGFQS
jgi:hypothetical protein